MTVLLLRDETRRRTSVERVSLVDVSPVLDDSIHVEGYLGHGPVDQND